jgi:hypothetical protein
VLELEGVLCHTSGSGKFAAFKFSRASRAGAAANQWVKLYTGIS